MDLHQKMTWAAKHESVVVQVGVIVYHFPGFLMQMFLHAREDGAPPKVCFPVLEVRLMVLIDVIIQFLTEIDGLEPPSGPFINAVFNL